MHAKRANLHPTSVVRPSRRETGKDGGNAAAAAAAAAASVRRGIVVIRRKAGAGIIVHVKAEWTTTGLGGISRAGHVAITGGFRNAAIGNTAAAVFRKLRKWTSAANRGDR